LVIDVWLCKASQSVVTALACFGLDPKNYQEAIATAIWQGGDTDTIAAMTSGLLGAHLGSSFSNGIPLDNLEDGDKFVGYVRDLSKSMAKLQR
jgi:poly(ADP-ribose) glycohydrolase ARH3